MKIYKNNYKGFSYEFVLTPNKYNKYCYLGVNYGGIDNIIEGKVYPKGIAHFIEHKLLVQEDLSDGYDILDKMGVSANAYTTHDKTVFFFNGLEILEPFKFLLTSFFNPHFNEEDINNEKDIIKREIMMVEENVDRKIIDDILTVSFKDSPYANKVAGDIIDIDNITINDIKECYEYFYTPSNAKLVLVGDIDILEYENIIKEVIDAKTDHKVIHNRKVEFIEGLNTTFSYDSLTNDRIGLAIKINKENLTDEEKVLTETYFRSLLDDSSSVYQELLEENIINNSISYDVLSNSDVCLFLLTMIKTNDKSLDTIVSYLINGFKEDEVFYNNEVKKKIKTEIYLKEYEKSYGEVLLNFKLNDKNLDDFIQFLLKYRIKDTFLAKKLFKEASYFKFEFKKSTK